MGQYFSSTVVDQIETPSQTPQRPPNCVDPRSPTQDIDRTPIQVDRAQNDENNSSDSPLEKDEAKPRRRSLRQKMFQEKKVKALQANGTDNQKDE